MFLRGCCDDCNNLSGIGAANSVVSGRTCPDGTYLNAFQVQGGAQCPPVVQSTPVAPAPVAPTAPSAPAPAAPSSPPTVAPAPAPAPVPRSYSYAPPAVTQREIYVPQIQQDYGPEPQFEVLKQSASGSGVQLAPAGSDTGGGGDSAVLTTETESVTVTPESKFPWWLVAIASAVFLNS